MNISFSTPYIAAVQGEIQCIFFFSKDENLKQILCHCNAKTLHFMEKKKLRVN